MIQNGFKIKKHFGLFRDPRYFSFSKKFGAVISLPEQDFDVWTPLETKDQLTTNICTAEGTTGAAEAQFGIPLDECFTYAATKKLMGGKIEDNGADPMTAARSAISIGLLPKSSSPFKVGKDSPLVFADIKNYPQDDILEAGVRKQFSVYHIDGQRDVFDSIRAAMWTSLQNGWPAPIMVGTRWDYAWNNAPGGVIKEDSSNRNSPNHEFVITGQKTIDGVTYLKAHLSSGEHFGDEGFFYFPREIANRFSVRLAFAPGDPDDNKYKLWNLLQKLYDKLYTLIKILKSSPSSITGDLTAITNTGWSQYPEDKKMALIAQTREICVATGLSEDMTIDLIRTIWAESGWNPNCVNSTTKDYGLCQFNIRWYIIPNNMTVQEVFDNPLKCVRIMAKAFKNGRKNDWIAYKNKSYLNCPEKYYKGQ